MKSNDTGQYLNLKTKKGEQIYTNNVFGTRQNTSDYLKFTKVPNIKTKYLYLYVCIDIKQNKRFFQKANSTSNDFKDKFNIDSINTTATGQTSDFNFDICK